MTEDALGAGVIYPPEVLDQDEDDGTMPANVADLAEMVIGHRIVHVEQDGSETTIELDNGNRVILAATDDCCAYTEVQSFLTHADTIDHIITGVGTTDGYTTWHIYADLGDVLELTVGWSAGNAFYYGYGLSIRVEPQPPAPSSSLSPVPDGGKP